MAQATAKTRKVSNPLGLAVMALLFERPMHPYEMAATLRARAKEESIKLNYGSLYSVVGALQRAGFIIARETVRESRRPERTIYELTDAGRVELHDWMHTLLSTPAKEYSQFEAVLSLMPVLPPDEVVALLNERVRRLAQEVERLRAGMEAVSRRGVERLFLIEAEYLLAMREAEWAWVVKLMDLIKNSPTFTRTWKAWHAKQPASPVPATKVTAKAKEQRRR